MLLTLKFAMSTSKYPVAIMAASALDDGQCQEFHHQQQSGLLIRYHGQVHAYLNRCPHQAKPLTDTGSAFTSDGQLLQCQQHQAIFTPLNGHCITGPCVGEQLTSIAVLEQDEQILLLGWPRQL